MTSRNVNTRHLAQNLLVEMAGKYPWKMMTPLGEALLNPETSQWLGMANISGLIEAIPEADILALADPEDRNGDGISGWCDG